MEPAPCRAMSSSLSCNGTGQPVLAAARITKVFRGLPTTSPKHPDCELFIAHIGFPKIRGTLLGVPIIRIKVFWGLYWGPPIYGNYHIV